MNIFWERQEGNLCRKHSINAYFGHSKISTSEFNEYCSEYNNYIYEKYNIRIDISSNDYVLSNDIGIVPYILKKSIKLYCFHLPINQIKESLQVMNFESFDYLCETSNCMFIYNHDHIWCVKKIDNSWKKIDSLSGISNFNIKSLITEKNVGIVIPRDDKNHWTKDYAITISAIKNFFSKHNKNYEILSEIRECVLKLWENNEMLSYLEPLSGLLIDIISSLDENHGIISIYINFLKFFEKNKTDKEFICSWFPLIIDRLLNSKYGKCI